MSIQPEPGRYRDLEAVARKLVTMSVNLDPPAFHSLPAARAVVKTVLEAVFLPLHALDAGPREHAFWATCAALIAFTRQESKRHAHALELAAKADTPVTVEAPRELTREELVPIYRHFLAKHEERLSAEEAALLRSLGVPGVHLITPTKDAP